MIGLHTVLAPILARLLRRYVSSGLDASNVRVRSLFFSRRVTLGKLTFRGNVIAEELRLPFEIDCLEVDGVEVAHAPSARSLFRGVAGSRDTESARCALGKVTIRASGMTDEDAARRGVDVEELRRVRDARERAVEVMVDLMRDRAEGESANSNASASSWKEAILGAILERLRLDIGRVEISYECEATMSQVGGADDGVAVVVHASMDGLRWWSIEKIFF